MGFASGSISFRRFAVSGQSPEHIEPKLLEALETHALKERDLGTPEEIEYGWSGGRHILDATFSLEHNVFNDCLVFGLRIDTNKVPGELRKAYQMMEEEALASKNPSGFISKNQKQEAKDVVRQKLDDELRSGRFRKSKLVPVLWDVPNATLYSPASSTAQEQLMEIFERTFGLTLIPLSAGNIAQRVLEEAGKRRDYEDLRPTRFIVGPDGESVWPEYPWTAKGPEPKDFLGNEFLTWLWHEADAKTSIVATEGAGDVTLYLDKSLDLDCAYGQTGKDSLRGDGPSRMPEARDALRSGKVPRKVTIVMDAQGGQFTYALSAEALSIGSLVLPEVEDAESPRTLFEERITLLRDFCQALDALYGAFLKLRASGSWEGQVSTIRKWIQTPVKHAAA